MGACDYSRLVAAGRRLLAYWHAVDRAATRLPSVMREFPFDVINATISVLRAALHRNVRPLRWHTRIREITVGPVCLWSDNRPSATRLLAALRGGLFASFVSRGDLERRLRVTLERRVHATLVERRRLRGGRVHATLGRRRRETVRSGGLHATLGRRVHETVRDGGGGAAACELVLSDARTLRKERGEAVVVVGAHDFQ